MGIIYEKRGHIAFITIDEPDHANTVDSVAAEALTEAWKEVWEDRDVRVAILTGTGDRFYSAGHRIGNKPNKDKKEEVAEEPVKPTSRAEGVFWPKTGTATRMGTYGSPFDHDGYPQVWKPVIAAINGWVAGWGFFNLLASTDIRIACEDHAQFKYGLLGLGSIGGGPGATLLPRQISYADAIKILLTDEAFDAREALRINLINEVVAHDKLMERAEEIAIHIATKVPPVAARMLKEFVVRYRDVHVSEAWRVQGLMSSLVNTLTTDGAEGREAFKGKRPPNFTGDFSV